MKSGCTVTSNDFIGFGIFKGDRLTFENEPPQMGDFTLIRHDKGYQLIRLIGLDSVDNYIICDRFTSYPHATRLHMGIQLIGRLRV